MPKHISVKTLDAPEFINLTPLDKNPGMSSCEIKVLYLEGNRNHSWITKEVATEMAKTLRGAPIVGYFKEQKDDFIDHGEQLIIDDEGLKFKKVTRPYGFVSLDAEVWFQDFEDQDDFGNKIVRTYLMTTGYLWTQQFPECQVVLDEGRPHSMELDKEKMKGSWAENPNSNIEFFIISDAVFQALCILGDDVEPCFEGSMITAPDISTSFTKVDDNFTKTLYTMMQELKFALQGGQQMDENKVPTNNTVEPAVTPAAEPETPATNNTVAEPAPAPVEPAVQTEGTGSDGSFACGNKEKDNEKDDDDKKKSNHSLDEGELIKSEFEELKAQFTALQEQNKALLEFKNAADTKEKTELINSFYMLSDEDKKDVVDNMANFTLEEIESKLAVKCLRSGVFNLKNESEEQTENHSAPATTFNLDASTSTGESNVPEWISACRKTRDNRN